MGSEEQHWACAECARKCSRIHGRRCPPIGLCFFKVMIKQFKESLIVPPKFARILGKLVGESIRLENSNGLPWEVKLLKVDDHLAFQQGWNEFVSFHSIQEGEFLVFKSISSSSFTVQIFGTSGCERLHFKNIASDMHKRCPMDCLCSHKVRGKNDTCKVHVCIEGKVPAKKNKKIRTTRCESVSSPHLLCKTDGEFDKRKRPAVECSCKYPPKDGRKHDNVHCCTKASDSARKKKATRTATQEILSAPKCAAKGLEEDANVPLKSTSHTMNNASGLQTATEVNYSEVPSIVTDDADKGTGGSETARSDVCAKLNLDPFSEGAEREGKISQMVPNHVCVSVIVNQVDLPELPCECESSQKDLSKEQEMILTLPSEFIPAKGCIEKSTIVEERSPYCTNLMMPCGKQLEANKHQLPTGENKANIIDSLSEIGISSTDCLEVPTTGIEINSSKELGYKSLVIELPKTGVSNEKVVPDKRPAAKDDNIVDEAEKAHDYVSSESLVSLNCGVDIETDSSKELGCKNLVMEFPSPLLSTEKVVLQEDRFVVAEDIIFHKATTANNSTSSQMPSSKFGGNGEYPSAYSMATKIFLADEQGTCCIVQNSTGNVGLNSASSSLYNVEDAKCKGNFAPTAKEVSFDFDTVPKDPPLTPIFGHGNEYYPSETVLIDTVNNSSYARDGQLDTAGNNATDTSEKNVALSAGDASHHMSEMPKIQEGSTSHEHGVKQEDISQENVEFKHCLKEAGLKAVKAEILESDDLPSPNSSYFSFSLVVNTLSWHELFVQLPVNWRNRKTEKKVVLLRDPAMRVWPVLYHESLKFIGFLGGWEAFVAGNNIQKGDTCRFESSGDLESMFELQISRDPAG